jgi:hypothetical protein
VPRPRRLALEKALVGPAGEHCVLYRLYRNGILASLAPPGTPTIDILVLDPNQTVIATVQVKARNVGRGWRMSAKHENFAQDQCFYAFVDLVPDAPVVYIVPSRVVADVVKQSHRAWLAAPGRKGQPHNDSNVRSILPAYRHPWPGYVDGWLDEYAERWDLLTQGVR